MTYKDGVEPLQERLAIDEVEALACRRPDVSDNEVDIVCSATNYTVEGPLQDTVSKCTAEQDIYVYSPATPEHLR